MDFRKEVKRELVQDIVPFWSRLRDDVYGGYYGYMDYDLHVDPTYEKGCILNSRILWFFSNAYLKMKEDKLLAEADHAYHFMKNYCEDKENGGVFWSVTYDGRAADTTKHTYNQAFAIYALSSYYEASGCEEALKFARELFHIVETRCRDEYGYLESFTRTWQPEDNVKLSENGLLADKTMNTLLHLLEAYTELYRVAPSWEVGDALEKIMIIFRDKVYNPQTHRLEVFFDAQMNTISDLYSYGHDIEASWLLDRACDVLKDEQIKKDYIARIVADTKAYTIQIAEEVYKEALDGSKKEGTEVGLKSQDESGAGSAARVMNNECFKGQVDKTRVWWVQAEAMVGFYNCYQKTGDEKYRKITEELWAYIKEYFIDPREGSEWFGELDPSGKPDRKSPIVEPWKCPYHNGRMCFILGE